MELTEAADVDSWLSNLGIDVSAFANDKRQLGDVMACNAVRSAPERDLFGLLADVFVKVSKGTRP